MTEPQIPTPVFLLSHYTVHDFSQYDKKASQPNMIFYLQADTFVRTLYFDRSILKELCNWSSSFMNFSLCTKQTQKRRMEIKGHSKCSPHNNSFSYCPPSTERKVQRCQRLSELIARLYDITMLQMHTSFTPNPGSCQLATGPLCDE